MTVIFGAAGDIICSTAASNGHLVVVEWLHKRGCGLTIGVCYAAARAGHRHVLQYARDHNGAWAGCVSVAAAKPHFELLQWLVMDRRGPFPSDVMGRLAWNGTIAMLEWAHSNGFPIDSFSMFVAAENAPVEALQWLHAHGGSFDNRTMGEAGLGGSVAVVQWLQQIGCALDRYVCESAACMGHLELLKWLKENGAPWKSVGSCANAAIGGQLAILQWLRANRCPWDDDTTTFAAQVCSERESEIEKRYREKCCF